MWSGGGISASREHLAAGAAARRSAGRRLPLRHACKRWPKRCNEANSRPPRCIGPLPPPAPPQWHGSPPVVEGARCSSGKRGGRVRMRCRQCVAALSPSPPCAPAGTIHAGGWSSFEACTDGMQQGAAVADRETFPSRRPHDKLALCGAASLNQVDGWSTTQRSNQNEGQRPILTTNSRSTGRCSQISSTTSFTTSRSSVLVKNSWWQESMMGRGTAGGVGVRKGRGAIAWAKMGGRGEWRRRWRRGGTACLLSWAASMRAAGKALLCLPSGCPQVAPGLPPAQRPPCTPLTWPHTAASPDRATHTSAAAVW